MKLYLKGHDYKYAVEQIMLTMFPEQRPEYTDVPPIDGDRAAITLSYGDKYATAAATVTADGVTERGSARAAVSELGDSQQTDRILQKILKIAFFRAAVKITGRHPAWGSLTGIRPGKLAANMLERGMSENQVRRTLEKEYSVSPVRVDLCMSSAIQGLRLKNRLEARDIALYVGIPFCPTRCAYCSFVSNSVEKSMKLVEPFLNALYGEITATARVVNDLGLRVRSLYIGGGTPTTLSADQLDTLINRLRNAFDLSQIEEFCVEAGRPDTIDTDKLTTLKRNGVTRISINPQTMSDEVLTAIGRHHTAGQVLEAYRLARDVGFDSINMDLIAGLPADTAEGFQLTLDTVMGLEPENITIHTLSLKKGTRITLEGTPKPDEAAVGEMLDYSMSALTSAGYAPYYLYRQKFMSGGFENIGWAKSGRESFYNIAIMEELCSIIAMGGGASTKLCAPETGRIERIFNPKYPLEYIEMANKVISSKEQIKEFYESEVRSDYGIQPEQDNK